MYIYDNICYMQTKKGTPYCIPYTHNAIINIYL